MNPAADNSNKRGRADTRALGGRRHDGARADAADNSNKRACALTRVRRQVIIREFRDR